MIKQQGILSTRHTVPGVCVCVCVHVLTVLREMRFCFAWVCFSRWHVSVVSGCSLPSRKDRKMHIDINFWLDQLNLSQYQPLFSQYVGVQVITIILIC